MKIKIAKLTQDKAEQQIERAGELQLETINALLEIAPEVLEEIHGGLLKKAGCDCCKWETSIH